MEENLMANMVRVGVVSSVDPKAKRARVIFPDKSLVSGWLYVLQIEGALVKAGSETGTVRGFMPDINDKVLCLYIPVFGGDGFILGVVA
ncbi:MAG: hypothetical protein RSD95_02880 [Clostridia bacterium]